MQNAHHPKLTMTEPTQHHTGGCLCGALRYEAAGPARFAGYCFCADCRKASGSGFMPFMGFAASQLRITGPARVFKSHGLRGEAARSFCPTCGSLVFGGVWGEDTEINIYAGSLDDPSAFRPTVATFNRSRPEWVPLPAGLKLFEEMPGG